MAHAGALGVYRRPGHHFDILVLVAQPAVYPLHQVCAVLIAAVDAPLQHQGLHGIYARVAYDVLTRPLHGVYPALQVKAVLYRAAVKRIAYRCVHVVLEVIIIYRPDENTVTKFGK